MRKFIAAVVGLLIATQAYAAFDDLGWTARSRAMGNAIFGDFDGVNSMNYNPATISMARSIQIYGSWDTPFAGLDDGTMINTINADVVLPFFNGISLSFDPVVTKRAALGFSVHRVSVGDPNVGIEYYHEGVYSMIYAKDLNDVISRGAKISAGVRLSLYDIGVGASEDVLANPSFDPNSLNKISFGLDVGITYDFSETIRLGLAYKNLIAPRISIFDSEDKLASEFRLGANWKIGDLIFMKKINLGFGLITYNRDSSDNRQADSSYNLGLEFRSVPVESIGEEIFAFRFGAIYQPKKSVEDVLNLSTGFGFMWVFNRQHQINVDYAFEYNVGLASFKHIVGLTYQIRLPNSAFVYKEELRAEAEYEEMMEEAQRNQTNAAAASTTTTTVRPASTTTTTVGGRRQN